MKKKLVWFLTVLFFLASFLFPSCFPAEELFLPSACADMNDPDVYHLVSDMIYTYKMCGSSSFAEIMDLANELQEADPAYGAAWAGIMQYWEYVNNEMTVFSDVLPDGLPEDDSLCIVVLGYELNRDGTMAEELVGRCRTALACAEKYPEAYIAVTGGGTAGGQHLETEAELMAEWFVENGLSREKIIVENRSMTTGENAQRTCKMILDDYPEIRHLAVVTSDYHIQLGCLVFQEQLYLEAVRRETEPLHVIADAVYEAPVKTGDFSSLGIQASYVWKLADTRE